MKEENYNWAPISRYIFLNNKKKIWKIICSSLEFG